MHAPNSLPNRLKTFIHDLQESDESRRWRWMIGLTAISMIGVVGLWVGYFSIITSPPESASTQTAREQNNPSVARTFGAGLAAISGAFSDIAGGFRGRLQNRISDTYTFTIEAERNFILDSLEPATPRSFP